MRWAYSIAAAVFVCVVVVQVYAARLSFVSDLISTSAPTTAATHTITFTATQSVPPGGSIIIAFENGQFDIPVAFDVDDVDFAVANGGPYVERSIAAAPDALNDGVTITAGTSGGIIIVLNSTIGVSSGEQVRIKLGSNASFAGTGIHDIINPTDVRSYRISITTKDDLNALLDQTDAMIAIVSPVGLSLTMPVVAPTRTNGLPSGLLAAGNIFIEISLETDLYANCRYATSTGVLYANMTGQFNPSSGVVHYVSVYGHQNDTTYDYYVRCRASLGAENSDDYLISFTLKPTPISNTSEETDGYTTTGATGDLGRGGSGEFPNGSNVLYFGKVTFSGTSIPGSQVNVLKDGVKSASVQVQSSGFFETTIDKLERGSYGFQLYTTDAGGVLSSLYGTSLTVNQGTNNSITNITLPPTIKIPTNEFAAGEKVEVSGGASPNSAIEVRVVGLSTNTSLSDIRTYAATSSGNGSWSYNIDTKPYATGIYAVQARVTRADQTKSGYSKQINIGVGTKVGGNINRSDINRDGKVNLVDFSILLSFWQTADPDADINEDGVVNLADFSVMLFNWTG